MTIADRFCAASEAVERWTATPAFFVAFNVVIGAAFVAAGVDVANIVISIATADAVFLAGIGQRRRDGEARTRDEALHAKLDELIAAAPAARDALIGAETSTTERIREMRP